MARTLKSDKLLFWATLLLVCASLLMVYSASAVQAQNRYQAPGFFLLKQGAWALVGFLFLLVVMRIDYHAWRRPAVIWTLVALVVAGLVAVFFFRPINGAQRWILLGPMSIQPSEPAKLAAICFAAALLDRRMHRMHEIGSTLVPVGAVTALLAGLILAEPDFGTAVIVVAVVGAVLFAAGLAYRYLFGTLLVLAPLAAFFILTSDYRRRRLMAFFDPWSHQLGDGFHSIQSFIALGSGGLTGRGLMDGVQKLYYIPEPHTDFIYAVIGEEFGLVGTLLVLAGVLAIAWRGLRAALSAPDRYGALLAMGLTTMVAVQALVNISVVVGLLPTTGIPLPLVSHGGSSLVVNLVAIGVLLNISQHASPTAAQAAPVP